MEKNHAAQAFLQEYTENFMEKVFYFCLRRCGGASQAEDLAGDISEQIVSALQRGVVPANFPAWVWKIARNRYAAWAERKRRTGSVWSETGPNALAGGLEGPEEALLSAEQQSLLRRELAFIAREYREIIVAFYIEDRKTEDIAKALGLPKGTVTARLCRCRKKLKEGMEMAREFGARSYRPENVGFIMNGRDGAHGEPWSFINKLLCKNILLAAYDAPQTAEELAIELGVALPYMEDELRFLHKETLLSEKNRRYSTDIFIVSAETQEKILEDKRRMAPAYSAKLIELCEFEVACFEENGFVWHEGYQPYEDMKWARLMTWVDRIGFMKETPEYDKSRLGKSGNIKRPNGGEWDLMGLEEYRGESPAIVGLHGCMDRPEYAERIDFGQFKFYRFNIQEKTPMHLTYEQGQALAATAREKAETVPPAVLEQLTELGYLVKEGETFRPTFRVTFWEKIGKLTKGQQDELNRLKAEAAAMQQAHYEVGRAAIYAEIPTGLKGDTHQIERAVETIAATLRGAVLDEALATGYLSYAENDERRMLGAYLNL